MAILRKIRLSAKAKGEIQWCNNNIHNSCHHINIPKSDITIYTNPYLTSWGIIDGIFTSSRLLA